MIYPWFLFCMIQIESLKFDIGIHYVENQSSSITILSLHKSNNKSARKDSFSLYPTSYSHSMNCTSLYCCCCLVHIVTRTKCYTMLNEWGGDARFKRHLNFQECIQIGGLKKQIPFLTGFTTNIFVLFRCDSIESTMTDAHSS